MGCSSHTRQTAADTARRATHLARQHDVAAQDGALHVAAVARAQNKVTIRAEQPYVGGPERVGARGGTGDGLRRCHVQRDRLLFLLWQGQQ
jgi:hypothetical protein